MLVICIQIPQKIRKLFISFECGYNFKKLLNLSADPVYTFFAPAKALCDLIETYSVERIDLLSLDVEGNELSVLQGCNLRNKKIKNILVESRNEEKITSYLSQFGYELIKKLSYHDYLYSIST